jgi:hypothetical protein
MTQETRAEEVARVRSYLAGQSMKRTPAQLVEALREAHQQFVAATKTVPEADFRTPPRSGEWAAVNVLAHVRALAAFDLETIGGVIERGEHPKASLDSIENPPIKPEDTRDKMLHDLTTLREQLIVCALRADPQAHLDITWGHGEFGQMHWREWLLFARVHTLDHARQMQTIAETLTKPE